MDGSPGGFALPGVFAVVLLAVALFSGCARHAAPAAAGHVLRISQRNEPTDLDPATASLPDEFFIIRALGEGLLTPNPTGGVPLPGAAESYQVSPDGLTYTFHLRANGQWSNGEPVTADDFVASYRRVLSPATGAPKAHLFYAVKNARAYVSGRLTDFAAVGVRATGPQTLVITLEQPTPNFPLYIASGPWIPVAMRAVAKYGRRWTEPGHYVGNGPFVLQEWRPQQRIVVRRNPRYRDAAHIAVDVIQFIRFDNADNEERAFRAGDVDVTMAVPQSKLAVYERDRPDALHRAPLAETRFLSFNTTRRPLDDARVRRALALAIDRQKLGADVLQGGQLPAERFLSPALLADGAVVAGLAEPGSGSTTPAPTGIPPSHALTFDPAEARRLLAEAGYPDGRGFPTLELAGWVQNPVLDALQQMWRHELGINVRIVIEEAKVHLAALAAANYDIAFVTNLLDVMDPVTALADFTADAPNNFPHWHSTEFDRLIDSASHATSARAAAADTLAAESRLLDSAAVAPVYFNTQNWLMSPRVSGWEQDALWQRRYNDVRVK